MSPVVGGAGTTGGGSGARDAGMRLRLAGQAGYSQRRLAGMAGVSRQAVSAVEAGHSDPSLRVALALARLWAPAWRSCSARASRSRRCRLARSRGPAGARVTLAPVGDGFVALPLAGPPPPGPASARLAVSPDRSHPARSRPKG